VIPATDTFGAGIFTNLKTRSFILSAFERRKCQENCRNLVASLVPRPESRYEGLLEYAQLSR
jgi:hypothetical protein